MSAVASIAIGAANNEASAMSESSEVSEGVADEMNFEGARLGFEDDYTAKTWEKRRSVSQAYSAE